MPGAQGATDSGARASVPYDTQLKKRKHIVPQSPAGNEGQGFAGFKACAGAAQKAVFSVLLVPRRSVTQQQQQTHHDDNIDTSDSSATIRDLFGSWMNFQCSCFACCRRTNHIQPSAHACNSQSSQLHPKTCMRSLLRVELLTALRASIVGQLARSCRSAPLHLSVSHRRSVTLEGARHLDANLCWHHINTAPSKGLPLSTPHIIEQCTH